jgi:formylglycine-generating enzyme required for sulfatase activity
VDVAPLHGTSSVVPVTITYTSAGGWTTAASCAWSCDEDYADLGDGLCVNTREVSCVDVAPLHGTSSVVPVTITYTSAGGWTTAASCAWSCDEDYADLGDGLCVNTREVSCVDVAPLHGTSSVVPVTITYTSAGGWTTAASCAWSCDEDYFLLNGACHASWVAVAAASFWVGTPDGACPTGYPSESCIAEPGRNTASGANEQLHYVTLSRSYEIAAREVTQADFESVLGFNPAHFGPNGAGTECGSSCPVESVSFYDALAYANELSVREGRDLCYVLSDVVCQDSTSVGTSYLSCMNGVSGGIKSATLTITAGTNAFDCTGYRLPSESEWEYAARAGSLSAFYPSTGNDGTISVTTANTLDPNATQIAWYDYNANGPAPVATLEANAWGLFDMSGNVWEWCWDKGFENYESGTVSSPLLDPDGSGSPLTATYHVRRGGSWNSDVTRVRSGRRGYLLGGNFNNELGFRLARTL